MYNRYIPQPDGSFRRSQVPDRIPHTPQPRPVREQQPKIEPEPQSCDVQVEAPPCSKGQPCPHRQPSCRQSPPRQRKKEPSDGSPLGVSNFLKQLLPKDFDTEDLLIVLLLLLMSGDCQEDQNTALLTLALYLFL